MERLVIVKIVAIIFIPYLCCNNIEAKGKCSIAGEKCPRWTDRQNMRYCCTSGCCDYSQYGSIRCKNNVDCPGRLGKIDETYCCESGCCSLQQYSTVECRENFDCPGRYGSDSATYCCKSGCCDFEQYSATMCTNGERCPGRYGEKDETFCCPGGCCGFSKFLNVSRTCRVNSDCANQTITMDNDGSLRRLKYCCAGGVCCDNEPFVPNTIILGIGSVIGIICLCMLCCGCCAFAWFMNSRARGNNPRLNIRAQPVIQVPIQMNNSSSGFACPTQQPMLAPQQQPFMQSPPTYSPQGFPQQAHASQQSYQQPCPNYPVPQYPAPAGYLQNPTTGYPQNLPPEEYSQQTHPDVYQKQEPQFLNTQPEPEKKPEPPLPGFNVS